MEKSLVGNGRCDEKLILTGCGYDDGDCMIPEAALHRINWMQQVSSLSVDRASFTVRIQKSIQCRMFDVLIRVPLETDTMYVLRITQIVIEMPPVREVE